MFSYWKWLDIDKGGMSNKFGEIQHEGWVIYRIKMLNCWDVYVVDHSSSRVLLVGLHSWDSNRRKAMANLISRHFLDPQILDQQNCFLRQVCLDRQILDWYFMDHNFLGNLRWRRKIRAKFWLGLGLVSGLGLAFVWLGLGYKIL